MKQLLVIRDWLARWWLLIVGVCAVAFLVSVFMLGREGGKLKQAIDNNPLIPKKEAKKLIARARADSAKAVVYKAIAIKATATKDSAVTAARTQTAQADSIHAEYTKTPAASGGPLSAVAIRLNHYQSPDTTGF